MIDTLSIFCIKNVRRNAPRILCTTHPYLSAFIALIISFDVFKFNLPINFSFNVSLFVTYDTVVFGFTATAIALAIAIPSPTFIKFLSSKRDGSTPFRDFLFILVWNGVVHICAFFVLIPMILFGSGWSYQPDAAAVSVKIYVFVVLWVQLYAMFQFLVTTIGVYELGDLYALYVAKEKSSDGQNN